MKTLSLILMCNVAWAAPVWAQSSLASPEQQTTDKKTPVPPSMTSSATTIAPVEAGSTQMHEVKTPVPAKQTDTSKTGGPVGGGGN